jgi:predicted GIY-YIG superfamily endonuclease
MTRHEREAKVYFAVDGEEGYYIGSTERLKERRRDHERYGKRIIEEFLSTHENRYNDEYELIEFAQGMGISLTNIHRKHYGNFKGKRKSEKKGENNV